MNPLKLKFEHLLYAVAFLIALAIRFMLLNDNPLSNTEASLALQAFALSKGQSLVLDPHALYLALTSVLMSMFYPDNWLVRFWPALAGSLFVLVPVIFRFGREEGSLAQRFYPGKVPLLLLSYFLALDPGLVALSRQAGSHSLALLFTFLALGLWQCRRIELAGVATGLALLSGPAIWPGLMGLTVAVLLMGRPALEPASGAPQTAPPSPLRRAAIYALATIFFAGTLFFMIPGGLSAAAGSIPAYLSGWLPRSGASAASLLQLIVALALYEFLPLTFGLWGGIRGLLHNNPLDRFLLVWWAIALVWVLAYPAHQVLDLSWSIIPMLVLAARQVTRLITVTAEEDRLPSFAQMVLTSLIIGFISMTAASMVNTASTGLWEYWVKLGGAAVMLIASARLIAWGWSRDVSLRGLLWGIGIVLWVYSIAAVWNTSGLSGRASHELWFDQSMTRQTDMLHETLSSLTLQGPKINNGPDLAVVNLSSPALRWILRHSPKVVYTGQLTVDSSPALVITGDQTDLALSSPYRGQGLLLSESVQWEQLKPQEWFRWLVFRNLPANVLSQERIILWARSDFFPGGIQLVADQSIPEVQVDPE